MRVLAKHDTAVRFCSPAHFFAPYGATPSSAVALLRRMEKCRPKTAQLAVRINYGINREEVPSVARRASSLRSRSCFGGVGKDGLFSLRNYYGITTELLLDIRLDLTLFLTKFPQNRSMKLAPEGAFLPPHQSSSIHQPAQDTALSCLWHRQC